MVSYYTCSMEFELDNVITSLKTEAGFSHVNLARLTGNSESSIIRWEKNPDKINPKDNTLLKIVYSLYVTLASGNYNHHDLAAGMLLRYYLDSDRIFGEAKDHLPSNEEVEKYLMLLYKEGEKDEAVDFEGLPNQIKLLTPASIFALSASLASMGSFLISMFLHGNSSSSGMNVAAKVMQRKPTVDKLRDELYTSRLLELDADPQWKRLIVRYLFICENDLNNLLHVYRFHKMESFFEERSLV